MGFDRVSKSKHGTTIYKTTFRKFDEMVKEMKGRGKEEGR
jgi:hypothetical protein